MHWKPASKHVLCHCSSGHLPCSSPALTAIYMPGKRGNQAAVLLLSSEQLRTLHLWDIYSLCMEMEILDYLGVCRNDSTPIYLHLVQWEAVNETTDRLPTWMHAGPLTFEGH